MRVTAFGATGKIGGLVIDQLIAEGHQVTAFVRNPPKLERSGPQLTVRVGQLADVALVQKAIDGADAVISALGPPLKPSTTGSPLTEGTRTIVAACNRPAYAGSSAWPHRPSRTNVTCPHCKAGSSH